MVNSKRKGKRGELAAVHLWRKIGFTEAKRGFQFRDGSENADVVNTGPWWVEVKTVKTMHPKGWLDAYDQALEASRSAFAKQYCELKTPLVMVKEDRKPWMVFVLYSDLVTFVHPNTIGNKGAHLNAFCKMTWDEFVSVIQNKKVEV